MAELSSRSGVPIPTIKFYLREGMLSAGELTSPNQARYDDGHVRRLKLIRALVDIGGLSVAAARTVLDKMDAPGLNTIETLGKVQYSLIPRREPGHDDLWRLASEQVEALLRRHGWQVRENNPARTTLTEVVAVLHRLGQHDALGLLDGYARAARLAAEGEVDLVLERTTLEDRAEGVIVVAILGDALLTALRRLAQEDAIGRRAETDQVAASGD